MPLSPSGPPPLAPAPMGGCCSASTPKAAPHRCTICRARRRACCRRPKTPPRTGPVWYRALFDPCRRGPAGLHRRRRADRPPTRWWATLLDAAPAACVAAAWATCCSRGLAGACAGHAVGWRRRAARPGRRPPGRPACAAGGAARRRRWLLRLRDLGDRQRVQAQLAYLSHYDSLTGLPTARCSRPPGPGHGSRAAASNRWR